MKFSRAAGILLLIGTLGLVLGCRDISIPSEPLMAAGQYDKIAAILGLSAEQTAAARDLYAAYRSDFDAARLKLQDYFERAERVRADTGDEGSVQRAKERARAKFDKHSAMLRERLLEDLRAVVTPQQMARWPMVERRLRREELGEWGGLHGSGVDVAAVFEMVEQPGDRTPGVQRALDVYEDAIDRPLLEGRKAKAEWAARQKKAAKSNIVAEAVHELAAERGVEDQVALTDADKAALNEHLTRILDISKSMQRLNLRTAEEVAGSMPSGRGPAFTREFDQRAFGEYHQPTAFADVLRRVDELEDLSAGQRERLARLRKEYEPAARSAGDRIARAVVAWEQARRVGDEQEPEPREVSAAKEARATVDERARRDLAALLTPEQLELFPGLQENRTLGEIEF